MTSNQIQFWQLKEQERSNRAKESETSRSNKAKEYELAKSREEVQRSNLAKEVLERSKQAETQRSNLVNEQLKTIDTESQVSAREFKKSTDLINAFSGTIKSIGSLF